MARPTFLGATRGVTGSAYLPETARAKVLLECGLVQGRGDDQAANYLPSPFNVKELDAVVVSHAHPDHPGRLPKLVAEGFGGPIVVTSPTGDLLEIMLKDAAFLELRDVEWETKKPRRAGEPEVEPLYTLEDVEATLGFCEGHDYGRRVPVTEGVEVRYRDVGHILGSAMVELIITEHGVEKKIVFSGDIGNSDAALLRDPQLVEEADVLLLGSTYGNRDHRSMDETLGEFEQILAEACENGGNVLIPAFAVGRTPEVIFRLGEFYQRGALQQQAVFLDSPMAIATTEVCHRYQDVFNREDGAALRQAKTGTLHSFLPILRYSRSTEESMALNRVNACAIIIAGSGMCNGGRIRHHFKHNLWRKETHVTIVGFQAKGTPGRALVDGAKTCRSGKEDFSVKAKIHTLGGFSAHAGQAQLLAWVDGFTVKRPRVYFIHGEADAKTTLSDVLPRPRWRVEIPRHGESATI